jgi:hypothetical protein
MDRLRSEGFEVLLSHHTSRRNLLNEFSDLSTFGIVFVAHGPGPGEPGLWGLLELSDKESGVSFDSLYVGQGMKLGYFPGVQPHHYPLGCLKLVTCYAGCQKRWPELVSPGGRFWACCGEIRWWTNMVTIGHGCL